MIEKIMKDTMYRRSLFWSFFLNEGSLNVYAADISVFGAWSYADSSSARVIRADDKVSSLPRKKNKKNEHMASSDADSLARVSLALIARPIKVSNVPRKYRSGLSSSRAPHPRASRFSHSRGCDSR